MIKIISKEPPKEMYKEVVCKRCGWTYGYIPLRDAIKVKTQDYGGGVEVWYYILCLNEQCSDPDSENGKTKIEVKEPK